ncbi:hypothetical protein IT399_00310 [Candidatus Nomurabacteria bacterium]|nr:hypothetical protein [Candidatus Nomurabacteria bacterium]
MKQNKGIDRIIGEKVEIILINYFQNKMTNKIKFIVPALALGVLLSGTAVFAEGNGTSSTENTTTTTTVSARKACIETARTTRVAAVKAASDVAKSAKADAKTARETEVDNYFISKISLPFL